MRKLLLSVTIVVLLLITAGCSSLDLGSGAGKLDGNGTGELVLYLADKPVNDVKQILVTIREVQINRDDEWQTVKTFDVASGEGQFDLLQLRFDAELLGQTSLPSGTYNQIRLIIAADKDLEGGAGMGQYTGMTQVVYNDDTTEDIFVPSGTQTGIKISGEFTIEPDMITELVMDVDVSKLLHQAGNGKIILHPNIIKVIVKNIAGNIEGQVVADVEGDGNLTAVSDMDIFVAALSGEDVIGSTVALSADFSPEDGGEEKPAGSFFIRGLPEGEYTLQAYPVDSDGLADPTYLATVVSGVTVTAGETTTLTDQIVLVKNEETPDVTP